MTGQTQSTGFIHNVFFWLKKGTSGKGKKSFLKALKGLAEIKTVHSLYAGKPAGTPRNVVDNSYDFALIVHFEDKEGHDAYQVDPIHDAFAASQSHLWTKVQVFDVLTK
jgi:Stress responsive A/B Barrel Domain